jgi:hypothetical protein
MKNLYFLLLFVSCCGFAQKKNLFQFDFQDNSLQYIRVDYPQYGIANVFVTFYYETDGDKIVTTAEQCLLEEGNHYHTYYYFVKLPKATSETEKQQLVSQFIQYIWAVDQLTEVDLYLNFGTDYSGTYKQEAEARQLKPAKRIKTGVSSKNVCRNFKIKRR